MPATPTDRDLRVAWQIAKEVGERAGSRTPWRRVSTLRSAFEMGGARFSQRERQRMEEALRQAGLVPDPPITEVDRGGTVKFVSASVEVDPVQRDAAAQEGLRIFISYRREDCQPQANGLSDGLRQRVPGAEIFMDIDTIPPGTDFEEFIRNWIENSEVVLVLIGDNWLDRNESGETRLDHPEDFVRLEVAAALQQGTMLLPVLVEGARMPRSTDLPDDVARIARLQSIELSDQRWRPDLDRLAGIVKKAPRSAPRLAAEPTQGADHRTGAALDEEGRSAPIEFPSRFTDRWFESNVPEMKRSQLKLLGAELEARGWWPGEIIDRAYVWADDDEMPSAGHRGEPANAEPFEIPSRVTTRWLRSTAPDLSDDQAAHLARTLLDRGWTAGEIEDHLYGWRSDDGKP